MLKVRGAITGNIILLKYQKEAIAAAVIGKDILMLLPTALRKSWILECRSLLLPKIVTQPGLETVYRQICQKIDYAKNESSNLQDKSSDTKFNYQRLL